MKRVATLLVSLTIEKKDVFNGKFKKQKHVLIWLIDLLNTAGKIFESIVSLLSPFKILVKQRFRFWICGS